jgi:hypothetical protein
MKETIIARGTMSVRQVVENYPKRKYPTLTAAQWLLERLANAQLDSRAELSGAVTALAGVTNKLGGNSQISTRTKRAKVPEDALFCAVVSPK